MSKIGASNDCDLSLLNRISYGYALLEHYEVNEGHGW